MPYLESTESYISYLSSDRIPFPRNLQIELVHSPGTSSFLIPRIPLIEPPSDLIEMHSDVLEYITSSIIPYVHHVEIVGNVDPLYSKTAVASLLENAMLFKIPVSLSCDATSLDEATIRMLLSNFLHEITISLDAASPETYQKLHGMEFEEALRRIQLIYEIAKTDNLHSPKIHLSFVALRDNIVELPQMLYLVKQLHAESLIVFALGEESEICEGQSAFLHCRDQAEEYLYKTLIEAEINHIPFRVHPELLMSVISDSSDLEGFLKGEYPPPGDSSEWRKDCQSLWNRPFISVSGDVKPCAVSMPTIGNLVNDSFQNIWFSKPFLSLRRNCLLGYMNDICSRCNVFGWKRFSSLKPNLLASDESFDQFTGWYETDLEEKAFRCSRERASIFLKRSGIEKFVLLQLRKLALPKASSKGTITLNNEAAIQFQLKSTEWEVIELPLPKPDGQDVIQIEINMSHSIRPSDLDESSDDPREKGIKLSRVWLEDWPQKVVFGQQMILLGYEVTPESWVIGGDVIFRTFWRSLDQSPANLKVAVSFQLENTQEHSDKKLHLPSIRRDSFAEDFLILLNGQPSSAWNPGTFVAHEYRFFVPEDVVDGHYRVDLNLYPEGSPKSRLQINRSDRQVEDDRALLGTVMISRK